MSDAALVLRARGGDELAFRRLVDRYTALINWLIQGYYAPGLSRADLRQEALIGLHKAVSGYKRDRSHGKFRAFARLCIERQVITALRRANRGKHRSLNEAQSLHAPLRSRDDERRVIADIIPDERTESNPARRFETAERMRLLTSGLGRCSDLERIALLRRADGLSLQEIADEEGCHLKAVDNAVQRGRKKLATHLEPLTA